MTHLWEVEHEYYCTEGNFFGNGNGEYLDVQRFNTWDDFLEGWGNAIPHYNLLFRWDWLPANIDEDREHDELRIYFMLQRKGFHISCIIDHIDRKDEGRVREYLMPRLAYLMTLWTPLMEKNKA